MFRIFHQIVTGKLGQSFLEASLYSVTLLLLVSVLSMIALVFSDETDQIWGIQDENSQVYSKLTYKVKTAPKKKDQL